MRIAEAIFRQIIKEEARRLLSEETIVAGLTVDQIGKIATALAANQTKGQVKKFVAGQATGLGAIASPFSMEAGVVTISLPALAPYIIASFGIMAVVATCDAAYDALNAIDEAADRNTKAAISQAKMLLWTAGINSGKNQGIFSSPILTSLGSTYKKFMTSQPVQQINQYRAMASGEYPNPAVELSQADKANIGVVFSMLTSADIDKAFSDAKQAVIDRASNTINDEIYNSIIADFKTKLAAMQQAAMNEVARLKTNQLIQQTTAQQAKERQTPAAQAAEQARLAALGREADKADFARGIVPASYKPVKR